MMLANRSNDEEPLAPPSLALARVDVGGDVDSQVAASGAGDSIFQGDCDDLEAQIEREGKMRTKPLSYWLRELTDDQVWVAGFG